MANLRRTLAIKEAMNYANHFDFLGAARLLIDSSRKNVINPEDILEFVEKDAHGRIKLDTQGFPILRKDMDPEKTPPLWFHNKEEQEKLRQEGIELEKKLEERFLNKGPIEEDKFYFYYYNAIKESYQSMQTYEETVVKLGNTKRTAQRDIESLLRKLDANINSSLVYSQVAKMTIQSLLGRIQEQIMRFVYCMGNFTNQQHRQIEISRKLIELEGKLREQKKIIGLEKTDAVWQEELGIFKEVLQVIEIHNKRISDMTIKLNQNINLSTVRTEFFKDGAFYYERVKDFVDTYHAILREEREMEEALKYMIREHKPFIKRITAMTKDFKSLRPESINKGKRGVTTILAPVLGLRKNSLQYETGILENTQMAFHSFIDSLSRNAGLIALGGFLLGIVGIATVYLSSASVSARLLSLASDTATFGGTGVSALGAVIESGSHSARYVAIGA